MTRAAQKALTHRVTAPQVQVPDCSQLPTICCAGGITIRPALLGFTSAKAALPCVGQRSAAAAESSRPRQRSTAKAWQCCSLHCRGSSSSNTFQRPVWARGRLLPGHCCCCRAGNFEDPEEDRDAVPDFLLQRRPSIVRTGTHQHASEASNGDAGGCRARQHSL